MAVISRVEPREGRSAAGPAPGPCPRSHGSDPAPRVAGGPAARRWAGVARRGWAERLPRPRSHAQRLATDGEGPRGVRRPQEARCGGSLRRTRGGRWRGGVRERCPPRAPPKGRPDVAGAVTISPHAIDHQRSVRQRHRRPV